MSSSLVITLAVLGGIAWLAFLGVSALRTRGKEQVPANINPGSTDEELETRRLEKVQQAAVLLSAFLAVGLPLYFLGENQRQDGFVEEFSEASLTRGEHLVAEFACFNCHGPAGSGGVAPFVEKRSGINVSWAAPSLDDVFYRYEYDEVLFWVTFGRGNTPMPAWGLAGGGPMNEQQVEDVVNYLQSIQIPQQDALGRIAERLEGELSRLSGADQAMADATLRQRQLIADIRRAPELAGVATEVSQRARQTMAAAGSGIDTDGDGLSDAAETEISSLTAELAEIVTPPGLAAMTFSADDPESSGGPDAETAAEVVATLEGLVAAYPILEPIAASAASALAGGEQAGEDTTDTDGDGLTDQAEATLTSALQNALQSTRPSSLQVVVLDPTNAQSVGGQGDLRTASAAVAAAESVALQLTVSAENQERLLSSAEAGIDFLSRAATGRAWEIDVDGVSAAFGGDTDAAHRAVGLFSAYCARCHTSGWSAGMPYTQQPGSGGFGPALWEGRPNIQFSTEQDLIDFITNGSEAQRPYGVNGFGSGRMPGFGMVLSAEDIQLIAAYLRSGNLTGGDE
jgi:mono/diheme cytochrome c family protein